MPSTIAKALQRIQGLMWGDGVKDSAAYFDGHTLVVDLVGTDASAGLLVRGLNPNTNAPSVVFQVNKDGTLSPASGAFALVGAIASAGGAVAAGTASTIARGDHKHDVALTSSSQDVTTSETTTSTSYTDLATPGPAITLTPGQTQNHLLTVQAVIGGSAASGVYRASVAIAGAAAGDLSSAYFQAPVNDYTGAPVRQSLATAQASGATHTMKYSASTGTGTYSNRRIIGVAI